MQTDIIPNALQALFNEYPLRCGYSFKDYDAEQLEESLTAMLCGDRPELLNTLFSFGPKTKCSHVFKRGDLIYRCKYFMLIEEIVHQMTPASCVTLASIPMTILDTTQHSA